MNIFNETLDCSLETRLMDNCDNELYLVLKSIKKSVAEIQCLEVSELENSLLQVMPTILTTLQQVYNKNNTLVQLNEVNVLDLLRTNFQVALSLMDFSNDILAYLMSYKVIAYSYIPSVPVNMANIIFATFYHCKTRQNSYNSCHKSISEILDLFRRTQEIHSKYLIFLDTHLEISLLNEDEMLSYRQILDVIVEISGTLSGMNMKSMVDNWKGFITLLQKSKTVTSVNLSAAIKMLSGEIHNNLSEIYEKEQANSKTTAQNLKVTGFLVKVMLKLLELDLNMTENYDAVLQFWITVYSWYDGLFRTNNFPHEIVLSVHGLVHLCSQSVKTSLFRDGQFFENFCSTVGSYPESKQNFGFLMFVIDLMKELPQFLKNNPHISSQIKLNSLLQLIFNLTRNSYMDFFCDFNSNFYENLVVNVSVVILLFPDQFSEVEKILLQCVLLDDIWTALTAIDVWCLILKNSTSNMSRSTLTTLIRKINELKLGRFHQTLVLVRLKILTQRIFKVIPDNIMKEEITKYNPTTHLCTWKILNLRNIPLSHRYYIEFLQCDIFDKINVLEREDCSLDDVIYLMERLDAVSYTKFNNLEINPSRLVSFIVPLWHCDLNGISVRNKFFRYVLYTLGKVTVAGSRELTGENYILILTQLKAASSELLFKLLICDILHVMSRRNFNSFQEKHALFSLMANLFQMLLTDKNEIVLQLALNSFFEISDSNNYGSVVHNVSNSSTEMRKVIAHYAQKTAAETKYNLKYFETIRNYKYQHHCRNSNNAYQPVCKKMKCDVDVIINGIMNSTETLLKVLNQSELNTKQKMDINDVISKLQAFVK